MRPDDPHRGGRFDELLFFAVVIVLLAISILALRYTDDWEGLR